MYEQLRKYPRASLRTELWIGQDGIFTRTDEYLSDLSVGGAFVQTNQIFPVGSVINLRFKIQTVTNMITCTAVVRNTEVGNGLGVEFLDLSRDNCLHVEQYVERALAAGT